MNKLNPSIYLSLRDYQETYEFYRIRQETPDFLRLKVVPTFWDKDVNALTKKKVDFIFIPGINDMYPADFSTFIDLKKFDNILCGK